ncbi:MAG TPA: hypothetical protein VFV99_15685, partial [Kofleriaceae bacterium]|nr:hypothetical protein [Kofleriaceae bacterium]
LLLVVGCAKKAAETGARNTEAVGGAPGAGAGSSAAVMATSPQDTHQSEAAKAPPPPPAGGGPSQGAKGGEGGGSAIDQARGAGVLGPTDQQAFLVKGAVTIKSASSKDLDAAVKEQLEALQACYDKSLEMNEKLAGDLTLAIKDAKASVSKTTVKDSDLEQCIVHVLEKVKLPKGKSTLVLSFKRQ